MQCTRIEMVKLQSFGTRHTNAMLACRDGNTLLKAKSSLPNKDTGLAGPNSVAHDTKPRL